MKVGIIGYGSMGKMIVTQMLGTGAVSKNDMYLSNRTFSKIEPLKDSCNICKSNTELASKSDIVFICVKPGDIKSVLAEISEAVRPETLIVSLNANILLDSLKEVFDHKTAKVVPSVTAEIGRSQTLVCFNDKVPECDKEMLKDLLGCMGDVYELRENEIGMGSELVSCMPGFITSMFDVICASAGRHIPFSEEQILQMVTRTLDATGELVMKKGMSFGDIVKRVATPGGVTEEGTKVIYEKFPEIADKVFEVTLAKRKVIAAGK